MDYVERQYHVDFRQYRRRFLGRRLSSRMHARHVGSTEAYVSLLREDPGEYAALLDALSINVSYFMRDQAAYDALREQVLVPLLQERDCGRRLSVWSAGCSKGEEPYSVAMLLADLLGPSLNSWSVTLHATDTNAGALQGARLGCYAPESFRDVEAPYVASYFHRVRRDYHLNPDIMGMVTWSLRDIHAPPLLPQYDLILCRNVLIYYVRERQESIVRHLADHLIPGGYLMLGMTEMLPPSEGGRLMPIHAKYRLYQSADSSQRGKGEADAIGGGT